MAVTEKVVTPEVPAPKPAEQAGTGTPEAVVTQSEPNWEELLGKAPKEVLLKALEALPDQDFVNHKRVQSEADRRASKVIDDSRNALNRTLEERLRLEREEATVEALKKLDPEDLPPKAKEWLENRSREASTQQAMNAALTQVWTTVVGPRSPIRSYINELPQSEQNDLMRMATVDKVDPGTWLQEVIKRHGLLVESRVRSAGEKDRDARVSALVEAELVKRRGDIPAPDLGASVREGTVMNDNDWLVAWGNGSLPMSKENFAKANEILGTNLGRK